MRVIEVTYSRKKQIARYEPEEIGFKVELAAGEDPLEAIEIARNTARVAFGEMPDEFEIREAQAILARTEIKTFGRRPSEVKNGG